MPDVSRADTLHEAIKRLRKRYGSHDEFAGVLAEMTGRPAKRQTVIPWEKPDGAVPTAYRDALVELGVPEGLFPTPLTRRGLEQRVSQLEGQAEQTADLIVRLSERLSALEAAPVRRARRGQQ